MPLLAGLLLLAWAGPATALDTLVVGTSALGWPEVQESLSFVRVSQDSLWRWPAEARANLVPGSKARGGSLIVMAQPAGEPVAVELAGLARMVDGDLGTAWGPDDEGAVPRQTTLYLDLGDTFHINRIRFYPRLDEVHRDNFLGSFEVGTNPGGSLAGYQSLVAFSTSFPNRQSVVDWQFEGRDARLVRLVSQEQNPWEIAEFEVYSDGTVPLGEFVSKALFIRGGYPIWGRVRSEGRNTAELPISIQTRTGPDSEPMQYFIRRGDALEKVSRGNYLGFDPTYNPFAGLIADVELGPIVPNPAWSQWQTVTDGQVLSPGPQRYFQFRILFPEAGTVLRQLTFEYVGQPLVRTLDGEISPLEAEPGQETQFTLSLEVHLNPGLGDNGFRYLEVLTPAQVEKVDRVRVDDQDEVFTARYQPGQGFVVDIWRRVVQEGSFVQVLFRAAVVRDGTPFQVRALDVRPAEAGLEEVYQMAREADVDPFSVGGQLVVRLGSGIRSLVGALEPVNSTVTPNGDGVNDVFELRYDLLKLIRPAPVAFEVFDLQGRRVRQGYGGADLSGQYTRIWDGCDENGQRVPPGAYLYRVQVDADAGRASRQGVVRVVY